MVVPGLIIKFAVLKRDIVSLIEAIFRSALISAHFCIIEDHCLNYILRHVLHFKSDHMLFAVHQRD